MASILLWSICEIDRRFCTSAGTPGGYRSLLGRMLQSGFAHAQRAWSGETWKYRTVVITR